MWKDQDDFGKRGQKSTFNSSVSGLATSLAIAATVLAAPQLYALTSSTLYQYLYNAYGADWASLLTPLFGIVEAAIIFFSARAIFSIAAVWITLALISRGLAVA